MSNQWLTDLIAYHLSRLTLHRLDYSPTSESSTAIRDIWVEHFMNVIGMVDQNLDQPRISEAFRVFEKTATKWPQPAVVSDLMPRRPEQRFIPHHHEEGTVDLVGMLDDELKKRS